MVDFEYIANEMRTRGISKFKTVPMVYTLSSPNALLDLDRYVYLFVSTSISCPEFTKIELKSRDNYLVFTKTLLEKMDMAQYQFFSEEMEIEASQYGSDYEEDFTPIRLEFIKIIPLEYEHKEQNG